MTNQYLKNETAVTLNEKGFPRSFIVGDKVKARFPPNQAELEATGRRSNHVSAWRGPSRVLDRLSSTTYNLMHLDTNREFERSISNLLPWRAVSNKKAKNAHYVDNTSAPFTVNEIIAVRDEPGGWFFVAKISAVTASSLVVHYFGTRSANLALASFYPGWHLSTQNQIQLSLTAPDHHIRYTGVLELSAINTLLVARDIAFTAAYRLTRKSRRLLMPVRDELFIFE
jgi:hypothetical protein